MTPDQREDYEERAAIMEYVGNLPRLEAERLAYRLVVRPRIVQQSLPHVTARKG